MSAAHRAVVLGAVAALASCGQAKDPPLASFGGGGAVPVEKPPSPPVVVPGTPPACTLTPDGGSSTDPEAGICGCEELSMLGALPNIYFVLDRSGSMSEQNKWPTIVSTVSKIVADIGPRANFGAAVFPDPNRYDCGAGIEVMSLRQGDSPAGTAGPVANFLVSAAGGTASGGTPTTATLLSLVPKLTAASGKTFVILATDGGPNCNASLTCTATQCCPNIEEQTGCPAGGTPNCCDPSLGGGGNCLDGTAASVAVGQLANAGIPVYVIGVPGSAPYASVLNEMAKAGGTARATAPYYYDITTTDQAAFLATVAQVAANITGACVFSLGAAPAYPNDVNVYLNNTVLPQSGADGWTLSGSTVTILGSSCASIMSGNVLDVRIVAGCPTVVE